LSTYGTEIPGAPGYEQANLLAKRAYDNAMSRYQQQRSSTLTKYGYNRDASGNLSVDPNNEYGGYQQMLRGEASQGEGLQRAQAHSGWDTGSGYLGQQREDLSHAQGGEQAALGTALTGELTGIDQGEQDAAFNRDSALYQNQLQAARDAAAANQFNPADYSGVDAPGYGEIPNPPAPAAKAPAKRAVPKKVSARSRVQARNQLIAKVRRRKGGR
jgi:hypothetical protein